MAFQLLVCNKDERARLLLGKKDISLRTQTRQGLYSYFLVREASSFSFVLYQNRKLSTNRYGSSVGTVGAINAPA